MLLLLLQILLQIGNMMLMLVSDREIGLILALLGEIREGGLAIRRERSDVWRLRYWMQIGGGLLKINSCLYVYISTRNLVIWIYKSGAGRREDGDQHRY